jgi:hypothetical protein
MVCGSFFFQKIDSKNQLNKTPRPPWLAGKSCDGFCPVFYQVESSAYLFLGTQKKSMIPDDDLFIKKKC